MTSPSSSVETSTHDGKPGTPPDVRVIALFDDDVDAAADVLLSILYRPNTTNVESADQPHQDEPLK